MVRSHEDIPESRMQGNLARPFWGWGSGETPGPTPLSVGNPVAGRRVSVLMSLVASCKERNSLANPRRRGIPEVRSLPVPGRNLLLASLFSIPCHFRKYFLVLAQLPLGFDWGGWKEETVGGNRVQFLAARGLPSGLPTAILWFFFGEENRRSR
jgi:hypothetical protein